MQGGIVQRSSWLWRDSCSVVRALVRKTRGSGFDPQLRCLNFFPFLRPSVSAFFIRLVCWNGLTDVFIQSGSARSYVTSLNYFSYFFKFYQLIKPFQHTSRRKKALTLGRRKEKRNWGSNPGPLVLRTSALTTELSCHSRELR